MPAAAVGEATQAQMQEVCVRVQRAVSGDVADTFVTPKFPTTSFGTSASLTASSGPVGLRQALLRFDLSPVPLHATITKATVTLQAFQTDGAPVNAHRATVPWAEASTRWEPFAGQSFFSPAILATFPGVAVTAADLPLALVQEWVDTPSDNHGLVLERDQASGATVFKSSDWPLAPADHPRLDVCYLVAASCDGQPDGTPCSDGQACTTADACQGGACQGGPAVVCSTDACHVAGTCSPVTGTCTPHVNKPNGTPCDDHNQCSTTDVCKNGGCSAGPLLAACPPPPDSCHLPGTCNPTDRGQCVYPAVSCPPPDQCHEAGTCDPASGACTNAPKADGAACDDGDACTINDGCQSGACSGVAITCTAPDACFDAGACDPATGQCTAPTPRPPQACYDGPAGTVGVGACKAGLRSCAGGAWTACEGQVLPAAESCNGLDDDCDGQVDEELGTVSCGLGACRRTMQACANGQPAACTPQPDGMPCDDSDACTQADTCQAGTCVGASPVTCMAQDQCHDAGTCDSSTGQCSNPAKPDGSACDDSDACTQADTCQAGTCVGASPVTCTAQDQCHDAGTCDPVTGACSNPNKADGTACDDGDACTQDDACQTGACAGTAVPGCGSCGGSSCDDGLSCTVDSCVADACRQRIACAPGTTCSASFCSSPQGQSPENAWLCQ